MLPLDHPGLPRLPGRRARKLQQDVRIAAARNHQRATRGRLVQRLFELGQLARALIAGLEMRLHRSPLGLLERTERVGGQVFERVTSAVDAHLSSTKRSRSFVIPRRTRLFTVPSGVFVRAAISVCEYPPQNASDSTSRCSAGSSETALRTRSSRSASTTRSSTLPSAMRSAAVSMLTSRSDRLPRVRRQSIAAFRQMARSPVRNG